MNWIKEKYQYVKSKWRQFLIATGIIGLALAAGTALLPEPTLTEVPIIQTQIGERYAHIFKDKTTGEIFEIETTKEKYQALALRNAKQPTYFNAKWVSSYGGQAIYATSTPVLQNYQYVVLSGEIGSTTPTKVLIKMPNLSEEIIDGNFIINNKLTDEGLTLLSL